MKTKPQRYKNLILEIAKHKPKTILEIGTWKGENAKLMIEEALKHQTRVYYFGFDLFEEITKDQIIEENSKKEKAEFLNVLSKLEGINNAKVHLIQGNTRDTIQHIPGQPIDFIFIDGGHSLDTIKSDWNNLQKFMYQNTIIILDDYYPEDKTKGCLTLIHGLLLDRWKIDFLEPIDEFENNFKVQMIKITIKETKPQEEGK